MASPVSPPGGVGWCGGIPRTSVRGVHSGPTFPWSGDWWPLQLVLCPACAIRGPRFFWLSSSLPPRGGWVGSRNYCLLCVAAHCVLPHAVRKEPLPHLAAGVRDCSAAGRRAPRSLLPVCFLAAGVSDWSACTEESPIPFGLFLLLGLGGSGANSRS